jgi:beta-N-acetylhexosaminidase
MQALKRIGIILLWFAGLVFVFAAANKNDPYLIALRGPGNVVLTVTSLVAFLVLIRHNYWSRRGIAGKLLVLLWGLPLLAMLCARVSFEVRKRNVLQTDVEQARSLGKHFVVGYSSFDEVATLAEKGLIAGIYITRHNVKAKTAEALKAEIAALQDKRRGDFSF